jgi:hypothetical protein
MDASKCCNWGGIPFVARDPRVDQKTWDDWRSNQRDRDPHDILEIAACVDSYKQLKKRFNLTYHVDRFYPKDEMKLNALKTLVYSP